MSESPYDSFRYQLMTTVNYAFLIAEKAGNEAPTALLSEQVSSELNSLRINLRNWELGNLPSIPHRSMNYFIC